HARPQEARRRGAGRRARAGGGLTPGPARRRGTPRLMTTPLSVYLPFNIDCLRGAFVPAKRGTKPPSERGNWLIIQDQKLLVVPDGDRFCLPTGGRPAKLDSALGEPIWLGTLGGDTECWVASLPKDAVVPDEFQRETLVPWAGFGDDGEWREGCVAPQVKEEVGVDVKDIRYVGSQNWPFPSQLMVGFVATYAGGEIKVDAEELEDARWFPCSNLPSLPSRHSISRFLLDNSAR